MGLANEGFLLVGEGLGGRGSAKCLRLLRGGGGRRGHAYVIIDWEKMLNNLHKFFQEITKIFLSTVWCV